MLMIMLDMPPSKDIDYSFSGTLVPMLTTISQATNATVVVSQDEERLVKLNWVTYGVVAPIIIAVGFVGNVANLIVLSRPNLKSVTYVYLMWLAITDLLCQLFIIPSLMKLSGVNIGQIEQSYASAYYHAHIELGLINALMAASVFIVVALTVDRYVSISKPTKFKKIHTYRRARWTILVACFMALLLNTPMCVYKTVKESSMGNITYYSAQINSNVVSYSGWRVYLWAKEIMTRLGPALLLAVLNAVIIRRFLHLVKKRRQRLRVQKAAYRPATASNQSSVVSSLQETPPSKPFNPVSSSVTRGLVSAPHSTSSGSNFREEGRLVMLLGGIVVMFFVAMTPAAFLSLFNEDDLESNFDFQLFRAFANDMEFLNFAMNFYVYCLCSSEIRRTFFQILCCGKAPPQEPMISTQQQQNIGGLGVSEDPYPGPRKSSSPSI